MLRAGQKLWPRTTAAIEHNQSPDAENHTVPSNLPSFTVIDG
jgi:hypothetical protein